MAKIRLVEEKIGSQHVITSPDVPGLFVAHSDLETARRDVQPTIEAMDRVRSRIAAKAVVEHKVASYA